jgi:cell wall-associated NlpC family hydrolase
MRSPFRLALVFGALVSAAAIFVCLGVAAVVGGAGAGLRPALAAIGATVGTATISAPGPAGTTSAAATEAVAWALAERGTPYRWGGEGHGGFDCSGLVQAAYAAAGVALPRVAQDQFDVGPRLAPGTPLRPGDLVFFGSSVQGVDHVGMVVATGEMVDAPHTGAFVRVEPIRTDGLVGATRPAP